MTPRAPLRIKGTSLLKFEYKITKWKEHDPQEKLCEWKYHWFNINLISCQHCWRFFHAPFPVVLLHAPKCLWSLMSRIKHQKLSTWTKQWKRFMIWCRMPPKSSSKSWRNADTDASSSTTTPRTPNPKWRSCWKWWGRWTKKTTMYPTIAWSTAWSVKASKRRLTKGWLKWTKKT